MDVSLLQNFDYKITAQDKLLHRGPLLCTEIDSNTKNARIVYKLKELQVFLFEKNIILSEMVGKQTQFTSPTYIYKAHIQVCHNRFLSKTFVVFIEIISFFAHFNR